MKLSIVTINYNNAEGLQETIESVIGQSFKAFEYLVIDGGSSDGSKELLAKHNDSISYWVSEPDKGIYNAMNKGIKKARGEYLLFLNSGDYLHDSGTIGSIMDFLSGEDFISGKLIHTNGGHSWINNPPEQPTFDFFVVASLPHPATFIKKANFENFGLYSEELKICSDWKFFIDGLIKHNCSYKKIDRFIAFFNEDGISSKPENQHKVLDEKKRVITENYADQLFIRYKKSIEIISYMKGSRLIKLLRKFGFFSKIDVGNI